MNKIDVYTKFNNLILSLSNPAINSQIDLDEIKYSESNVPSFIDYIFKNKDIFGD